jgi:hypothetical protein
VRTSQHLTVGHVYTRKQLGTTFGIIDASLKNGIFKPKGHDSVWLFVTEEKTPDRTQYVDRLTGDILEMEGQTTRRTDRLIIDHESRGLEIILFYRKSRQQYPGAGFKYEGQFVYEIDRPADGGPTAFKLVRQAAFKDLTDVVAETQGRFERRSGKAQGFAVSAEMRKTLEEHAVARAVQYFEDGGFRVKRLGKPYDLICEKSPQTKCVEVKGTTTSGEEILLTAGEVEFACSHPNDMALFVCHDIILKNSEGKLVAQGGVDRIIDPWRIDRGTLWPIGFWYAVPPESD